MNSTTQKIDRIKALKNSKGLQYLVNAGSRILENPIYIHNIDFQLLAATENTVTDDPLWNEMVNHGSYSHDTLGLLADEYFFDAIANADTMTALYSDKLQYDRALGKIFTRKHMMVACTNIVACKKPFTDDDRPAFAALCKKIARVLNKDEFYQHYGESKQTALIKELVSGTIEDKRLYSHRVDEIYRGLGKSIYVAVANMPAEGLTNTLQRGQQAFKRAQYGGHMVIIAGADDTCPDANNSLRKLRNLAHRHQVRLGISSAFENLFELREYYAQACALLCGAPGIST